MILAWLIIIPFAGGLAAWLLGKRGSLPRWISLASLLAASVLLLQVWSGAFRSVPGNWHAEYSAAWIPQFGIGIHLAADGLSLVLVALTLFLGILSVLCSWTEVRERSGFFHMNLMAIITGVLGVFLSLDLFLFYFFWEVMLVPMYFLISIWGHEHRTYASIKFFIFTQAGSLFMLLAILALYFYHGNATGTYTFDFSLLSKDSIPPIPSFWMMLGFLAAFLVKVPAFPFHPWLPDAHTEAPTAGSVLLAGLLLKTGAYGILRFVLPLFPLPVAIIAPLMQTIAVIGIIYGAVLSFAQSDLKRLVAYTSVSHMGFVLLGIFSWNMLSMQGAVMQMVAHGVSTAALFIIVGLIQERTHTRDMDRMGGFWSMAPRLSGIALVFGLASLGLPGFANFIAEFMVLLGSSRSNVAATIFAASGLIFSAIYALWMIQRTFQGEDRGTLPVHDLSLRETGILAVMAAVIIWLGFFPMPMLKTTGSSINQMQYIPASEQQLETIREPVKIGKIRISPVSDCENNDKR